MKRIALPLLISFIFLLMGTAVQAQPVMKGKAKNVINRSAIVIYAAHKYTIVNQVFTGNLKKAVVHQNLAISLYKDGLYMRAIHHSRYAREFAALQLEANKGTYPAGFEPAFDELPDGPEPNQDLLDFNADESTFNSTISDDEELSKEKLDNLEIKE
ncbi:MAG: hypothetical protein A2W93_13130 [Bacteroidetes bacterium GWF2_43_63]|nr:MAG: hypothetical protein A2W94_03475 [Bacteroidetes bacterium GWE2_42_42]OFY55126.1 MAG: hypothetical protein A2W93_13130 [Bacteroidetes bacterium GWF2_43_63]HBG70255.1 hypothetical protein [Bacteroidales bacterium]HCB63073.1 hypothetical protein [Bacteroidales bacterium]HCY22708.1 hypothetical protein [Bacteroidales bacterium]